VDWDGGQRGLGQGSAAGHIQKAALPGGYSCRHFVNQRLLVGSLQLEDGKRDPQISARELLCSTGKDVQHSGLVHFPISTQNIFSSTHHIKSFDACMEH
jgi:hypothetical protein